jgi:hypothetical protein
LHVKIQQQEESTMPGPADAIEKKVIKEIGKKAAKMAVRKAGSRFLGHITRKSRVWIKAFEHIAEHFEPAAGKASHAIFEPKFRSLEAVETLLKKALSGASRQPLLTKLTIDGVPAGKPAVVIERQFTEVIGRAGKTECRILRIVVDFTGRPITAFPADKFLGAAVLAVAAGTAGSASASEIPSPVQDAYAREAETYESLIDRACEPTNWVERVIDFLVDPSCIAPDPEELISNAVLEDRIQQVIDRIEKETGFSLDKETRENIAEDVKRIWGRGDPKDP